MTYLNQDIEKLCRNWCPRRGYCPIEDYCNEMKTIRTMLLKITNDINEEN